MSAFFIKKVSSLCYSADTTFPFSCPSNLMNDARQPLYGKKYRISEDDEEVKVGIPRNKLPC